VGSRIIYSLPWPLEKDKGYPQINWQGGRSPLLNPIPAAAITDAAEAPPSSLRDQIVIVGSSFADSRDIYYTPLGEMPGSMVIANALVSLQTGQAREWPQAAILPIEFLLIIGTAFAFSRFKGFRAKLVATGVTLLITLPLSFFLFRTGVWLDFAIPLAVVELHASISEIEESLSTHGDHS
jgi:CHASE2 domain-containing sensor protein